MDFEDEDGLGWGMGVLSVVMGDLSIRGEGSGYKPDLRQSCLSAPGRVTDNPSV